jgi:hypothetical protein
VFPIVLVKIPPDIDPGFSKLALFTQIQLYDDIVLDYWESALTQPVLLSTAAITPGARMGFSYHLGPNPKFEWQIN